MNERKYCVYIHKNKITGKIYVGITCMNPETRWAKGDGYRKNKEFNDDIQKHGWDNFEHVILHNDLDIKTAKNKEKFYINQYKDNCYNKTKGGETGKLVYMNNEEAKDAYIKKKIKQIIKQKQNKEQVKNYQKNYYNSNDNYRQYKIEYQKKYRQEHKEEIREYQKKYSKTHNLTK